MVGNLMIRFAVWAGGLDNRVYLTGALNQLLVIVLSSDWRGERGEARPGRTTLKSSGFSFPFVRLLTFIKPFSGLLLVAYNQGLGRSVPTP